MKKKLKKTRGRPQRMNIAQPTEKEMNKIFDKMFKKSELLKKDRKLVEKHRDIGRDVSDFIEENIK